MAVEYDGWIQPGARHGDLSLVWHEDPDLLRHPEVLWHQPPKRKPPGYWLQAGSYANTFCALFGWPDGTRLDKTPLRLREGVRHRFRVELDGRRLRMWVDGRPALEHDAVLPITTGQAGRLAKRPAYSVLSGERLASLGRALPDWRQALKRFVQLQSHALA